MIYEAINRANPESRILSERKRMNLKDNDVPCVFISYQREDEVYAENVARYIQSQRIDVYFDKDDRSLRLAMQVENPKKVTECITKAINESDYMIVVVSNSTLKSPWIPFEIGYAYEDKVKADLMTLNVLKHKDVSKLPQYLQTIDSILGYKSFDEYLNKIKRMRKEKYDTCFEIQVSYGQRYRIHPLSNFLTDI